MYYTESVGPTVSLFVVKNDDEAIKLLANDTEYRLTSAVLTSDLQRDIKTTKNSRLAQCTPMR